MPETLHPTGDDPVQGPPKAMRRITGGTFLMGSERFYPEEAPLRYVMVDPFWMDETPVTNRQFAEFVAATGYVTVAERSPDPAACPGIAPEALVAGSLVFTPIRHPVNLNDPAQWWRYQRGACWRNPEGDARSIAAQPDHPVTHVTIADAQAYAHWTGKDLPTEAEWEFAARSGLAEADYAWGDELTPQGVHMANLWQGAFPYQNLETDGFGGTSPVRHFPPNAYGLFDLIGNVWEWTLDIWALPKAASKPCCAPRNPRIHSNESPHRPATVTAHVLKGGSHLCAPSYCQRYRPAARTFQAADTSTSHIGFRCVRRSHLLQDIAHDKI
ncbi:MAG: formylglycine-generating enzyme family protein [Asticcacaulis sp.]